MVANLNYVQVRFEWTEGSGVNKTTLAQWHLTPDPILKPCTGKWGLVFKEWEVIKQVAVSLSFDNLMLVTNLVQTYPSSVQNLNRLTMTVDVDIYDEESQKVEIPAMPGDSPIKVIVSLLLSLTVGRLRQ